VHLRSYAIGVMPSVEHPPIGEGAEEPPEGAIVERRDVIFAVEGRPQAFDTPFYDRSRLLAGNVITGPAVVEQLDSTTVIPPGMPARVLPDGGIVIDCAQERQP
jgi:N-methylhydantoinase A/oxoprolinase/acetone carboxylase beta subunit